MVVTRRAFVGQSLLASAGFLSAAGCRSFGGPSGRFELTVLNPDCMWGGAGLAVVIRTPAGKTYLFDTGNGDYRGRRAKNNGRDIIEPWLRAHGIAAIDGLILSHYHADHFGGLLHLAEHFPIRRIFDNSYVPGFGPPASLREVGAGRDILEKWEARHPGCLRRNLVAGDDLGWDEPGVTFEVAWPPKTGYCQPLPPREGKPNASPHHLLNANSTALRITVEGREILIFGDINCDYIEAYMRPWMQARGVWHCDVAVLPAHGIPETRGEQVASMDPKPKIAIGSIGNLPWMLRAARRGMECHAAAGFETYYTCLHGDVSVTVEEGVCRASAAGGRLYACEPLLAADGTFSVACVNCGAHGYADGKTSKAEYAGNWERLFDERCDSVFFLEDAVPDRDPKACLLYRAVPGPLEDDLVRLVGEEAGRTTPRRFARRLVYAIDGRKVAFYGVHLVAESHIGATRGADGRSPSQRLRRRQFEELLSDAAKFDAAVLCGDFNAQAIGEYDVFVRAGYALANGSSRWGTHATLRNIPADNIIASPGLELVDFAVLKGFTLDTDHVPLAAHLRFREGRRS